MTPREAALDLSRPYVQRGDSMGYLMRSSMSYSTQRLHAQIGGWMHAGTEQARRLRADQVGVEMADGQPCSAVFTLTELMQELRLGGRLVQGSLFDEVLA